MAEKLDKPLVSDLDLTNVHLPLCIQRKLKGNMIFLLQFII